MSSDYFRIENEGSLSELSSDASIHLIGVCGVAMGQLAVELAGQGFRVTGSDDEFYPPISDLLEQSSVIT